jgi:hypothetical protein
MILALVDQLPGVGDLLLGQFRLTTEFDATLPKVVERGGAVVGQNSPPVPKASSPNLHGHTLPFNQCIEARISMQIFEGKHGVVL